MYVFSPLIRYSGIEEDIARVGMLPEQQQQKDFSSQSSETTWAFYILLPTDV